MMRVEETSAKAGFKRGAARMTSRTARWQAK